MSLDEIKEFNHSIKITIAFYMFSMVVVATGSWYVSDVHTRFSLQNDKIHTNAERVEYINDRHDRKYERLEDRLKELEKPK